MKCSRLEKSIALYVEADLSRRRTRRVEAHLAACAACRGLAEDLAASQAAFRSLGDEPVDAAVFDALRRGVLGRIASEPVRAQRRWLWAGALAAAAAAVAIVVLAVRPDAPPAPQPPEAARLVAPALPAAPLQPARNRDRQGAVLRRRPAKPAVKTEPLLVKLETADPNVVIYWIVDSRGESE